jgi:hypothetical protein
MEEKKRKLIEVRSEVDDKDEGVSLNSNEESGSESEGEASPVMNDLISLLFVEPGDDDWHVVQPEFTHQLFDEEKASFLQKPEEVAIFVNINCMDLAHVVGVSPGANEEERENIWAKLEKGLPPDAVRHNLIDADEVLDPKYQELLEAFGDRHKKSPKGNVDDIYTEEVNAEGVPTGKLLGPGELIDTFDNGQYELYLANSDHHGAAKLLARAEKVSMWFIETADAVDFEGDKRWEVLFLFKRIKKNLLSLCGYFTLFTFRNPLAGCKMRVCQCLILPYLQGKGIGRKLLLAAYKLAEKRHEVSEVTVEDPAPAFQRLRDAVDFEWHQAHSRGSPEGGHGDNDGKGSSACVPSSLEGEGVVEKASKSLKLIPTQLIFLQEFQRYASLAKRRATLAGGEGAVYERSRCDENASENRVEAGKDDETALTLRSDFEKEMRAFRLGVKRRILKELPDLAALPKPQMQKELESEYEAQKERYESLLRKKDKILETVEPIE